MSWITESNRINHLVYGIPCGLFLTILFVLGVAVGMEYKDHAYGNKFDWLDVAATMIGGVIGQLCQLLTIAAIW